MSTSALNEPNPSARSVVVLGANGRLGKAAVAAFHASGWRVRAFVRDRYKGPALAQIDCFCGDAFDQDTLYQAVRGFDVIVNALNVPYAAWAATTPKITDLVSNAAAKSGATVLLPGNIYHYGESMPSRLFESTPAAPSTPLGQVRLAMEQSYARRSVIDRFQTIIVRAGDFFGAQDRLDGGWFDSHIAANVAQGKFVYPGPMDRSHVWAYLPDLARAMVELAQRRHSLPKFCAVSFPGFTLTGAALVDALERAIGLRLKVTQLPWWLIRLGSWFSGNLHGVLQMRYLWNHAHEIDGEQFQSLLPSFKPTPLSLALSNSIAVPQRTLGSQP